jgi:hypothetical protein
MNAPLCERAAGSCSEELGKLLDTTATSIAAAHAIERISFI